MATKKTTSTITTRQIYDKVCAMEKMLKECLEVPPPASPDPKNQPYLAAAGPDLPLSVIRLDDAPAFLPCFDEADLFYGMQDIPVIMSYCPEQVLRIGEEHYLTGPTAWTMKAASYPSRWMTCTSWPSSWRNTPSF